LTLLNSYYEVYWVITSSTVPLRFVFQNVLLHLTHLNMHGCFSQLDFVKLCVFLVQSVLSICLFPVFVSLLASHLGSYLARQYNDIMSWNDEKSG